MEPRIPAREAQENIVLIQAGHVGLVADLRLPDRARGLVIFAHGASSSRHEPRNQELADTIRRAGLGTVLVDLLRPQESYVDADRGRGRLRFDIDLLTTRLVDVIDRIAQRRDTRDVPLALCGLNGGAGAAIIAAALRPRSITSVVTVGGQPSLAEAALAHVQSPALLIAGGDDAPGVASCRAALLLLRCPRALEVIREAMPTLDEPGALDEAGVLAREWFLRHCVRQRGDAAA